MTAATGGSIFSSDFGFGGWGLDEKGKDVKKEVPKNEFSIRPKHLMATVGTYKPLKIASFGRYRLGINTQKRDGWLFQVRSQAHHLVLPEPKPFPYIATDPINVDYRKIPFPKTLIQKDLVNVEAAIEEITVCLFDLRLTLEDGSKASPQIKEALRAVYVSANKASKAEVEEFLQSATPSLPLGVEDDLTKVLVELESQLRALTLRKGRYESLLRNNEAVYLSDWLGALDFFKSLNVDNPPDLTDFPASHVTSLQGCNKDGGPALCQPALTSDLESEEVLFYLAYTNDNQVGIRGIDCPYRSDPGMALIDTKMSFEEACAVRVRDLELSLGKVIDPEPIQVMTSMTDRRWKDISITPLDSHVVGQLKSRNELIKAVNADPISILLLKFKKAAGTLSLPPAQEALMAILAKKLNDCLSPQHILDPTEDKVKRYVGKFKYMPNTALFLRVSSLASEHFVMDAQSFKASDEALVLAEGVRHAGEIGLQFMSPKFSLDWFSDEVCDSQLEAKYQKVNFTKLLKCDFARSRAIRADAKAVRSLEIDCLSFMRDYPGAERIKLSFLPIGDEILKSIIRSYGQSLKSISMDYCDKITDDGMQFLLDNCPGLLELEAESCHGLTPGMIAKLKAKKNLMLTLCPHHAEEPRVTDNFILSSGCDLALPAPDEKS